MTRVIRNLVADGRATEEQARRLVAAMSAAFDGGAVPQDAVEACKPFAIEPLQPDAFLIDLYNLDPPQVHEAVVRRAAVLQRPPMALHELLDRLAATVPDFAETLRHHRRRPPLSSAL